MNTPKTLEDRNLPYMPDDMKINILASNEYDPNGYSQNQAGAKLDAGKSRPHLMLEAFAPALSKIAEVTTVGAKKYTPNGWMEVPNGIARYKDAAYRHQLSFWQGDKIDADTGCDHEAQVIWNLLAAYTLRLRKEKEVSCENKFTS